MKTGNIMLIHSKYDPIAWLIRKITKSYWNHVAWVVHHDTLLEATASRIGLSPIGKYLNWKYDFCFIKLKNISEEKLQQAISYALQFQTKRHYISYLKLLIKYYLAENKVPIMGFTCSNFIARGLETINYYFINPKFKSPYFITPKDIAESKNEHV